MSILTELNDGLAAMADSALAPLVQVRSGRHGAGAGVILRADGLIATNAHVLRQGRDLRVILSDGSTHPARVVARAEDEDLALIQIEMQGLPAAQPGESRELRPGQWVLALGFPWGVAGAATGGVIIASGEALSENPMPGREFIAVSLHYRPGHSGGPLVDSAGRVIGLNTIMAGPEVGLAIPIHRALALMEAAATAATAA